MWKELKQQIRPALTCLIVMSALTGLVYPALVTAVAQTVLRHQANGSMIARDGRTIGSEWIGQTFTGPKYFWGRPSATTPDPYNAAASAGSNLGPTNPALVKTVGERVAELRAADPSAGGPIPIDLVTASASGLDPDITPAAALYQAGRVARARGLPEADIRKLVAERIQGRTFGILGEGRINVLRLNLALDKLSGKQ